MCLEALDKKIEDGLVKRDDLEKYLDRLETEADIVKYIAGPTRPMFICIF